MSQTTGDDTGSTHRENVLWTGRPSQWVNARAFSSAAVVGAASIAGGVAMAAMTPVAAIGGVAIAGVGIVMAALIAGTSWLKTRCMEYTLTAERLRYRRGVLTKHTDEIELYRVRDSTIEEPFLQRMVKLGNIVLITSDRTHPTFHLAAIPDVHSVAGTIRDQVEAMRRLKRVREVDFE